MTLIAEVVVKERKFFIDNVLVLVRFITDIIERTGLVPWEFQFPFPGSPIYTFLEVAVTEYFRERPVVEALAQNDMA